MTSSRVFLAYCFGGVAALLASCAKDNIADTSNDTPPPADQGPSDSGGSSNPYVGDGAGELDAAPPPRKEAGLPDDSGFDFETGPGFDGGSCGADFLNDTANCGYCGHDCQGGECHSGKCQALTVADGVPGPLGIAIV